jgi:hypothetical protein
MKDLARVVGKSREMNTILLAGNCLAMLAFLDVKEMHGLIIARADQMLALVVKIQRCHVFSPNFFFGGVKTLHESTVNMIPVHASIQLDVPS